MSLSREVSAAKLGAGGRRVKKEGLRKEGSLFLGRYSKRWTEPYWPTHQVAWLIRGKWERKRKMLGGKVGQWDHSRM